MSAKMGMLLLSVMSLSACGVATGNGKIVEDERTVSDFDSVEVSEAVQAEITLGNVTSAKLIGDSNLVSLVRLDVFSGRLTTSFTKDGLVLPSKPMRLVITTPVLHAAYAHDSATVQATASPITNFEVEATDNSVIRVTAIQSDLVRARLADASRIVLTGQSASLDLVANDASKPDLSGLPVKTAKVSLSGTSSGAVAVSDELRGFLANVSHLDVYGQPSLTGLQKSEGSSVKTNL